MANVRGAAIETNVQFVRETFGADALARIFETLQPATRTALGDPNAGQVLSGGWYDYRVLTDIGRQMDRLYGRGDLALVRAAGKYGAFSDINRFFKWLLRLAGPNTLFARSASVFANYHSEGRYVVERVAPHSAAIRLEAWDSADPIMCKRIEGWIERALEVALGKGTAPVIREDAHLDYDPAISPDKFCRFVADW